MTPVETIVLVFVVAGMVSMISALAFMNGRLHRKVRDARDDVERVRKLEALGIDVDVLIDDESTPR